MKTTNHTTQLNHNPKARKTGRAILVVCIMSALFTLALHAQTPTIKSVSAIQDKQWQTITIKGTNFGTQAPYIGDSSYIALDDSTAQWVAGYSGTAGEPACNVLANATPNDVTLIVDYWSETEIVLGGFSGDYGLSDWDLNDGDTETVCIWNASSGAGPAVKTVRVH